MSTEFKLYNVEEKDLYKNKSKEERQAILLEMVEYALKHGNKPAARYYNTCPKTVRRWVNIYKEFGESALIIKPKKS